MLFNNMSNCVKNDIHNRIKGSDSIVGQSPSLFNTSFTTVNNVNTRPKRMFCHESNGYTESIEPIIIRRYNTYVFAILSKCNNCNKLKQCLISDENHIKFLSYYFDLKVSKFYLNEIEDNNGILHKLEKDLLYIINEPSRTT